MEIEMNIPRVTDCGLWGWRPSFLKIFNTPNMYLVLFSISSFAISTTLGMNQVLIPTLQQLFNLNSKQIGLILISNDLSGLVVAFIFGHFASKGKMRWLLFGVIINLIANLLQSGTQLFVKLPEPSNNVTTSIMGTKEETLALCTPGGGDDISINLSVVDSMFYAVQNNKLFWILFLAGILQGIGSPQAICGLTYLDEVMTKKKLGPSVAVNNVINLLGFSVSFVFGAYLLTQYVTLGTPPDGVTLGSGQWVGAWWMGYLAPGILLALSGIPLILFPTQMPAAKAVLQEKIDSGEASQQEKDSELNRSFKELIKDLLPTVKRLMKNKALLFLLAGEALNNIFLSSMPYDTKLLSDLFKISYSETGMFIGILRTVGTVVGLALGGLYMGKFNPSGKTCVLFAAVTQFVTLAGPFMSLYHCNTDIVAGITVPYPTNPSLEWNKGSRNLTDMCNGICSCSTDFYEPVCDLENMITYFSPCHAGCSSYNESSGIYQNCQCSQADLVPGACPAEDSCSTKKWTVFIVQQLLGVIIFISQYPAVNVAYLRVVPEIDRSATQGMKQFFTRGFGFLLGPIIFGAIIDNYCVVWRGGGSCWLYDLHDLIVTFTVSQLGFRIAGAICMFIAWRLYPARAAYTYIKVDETAKL
ncbi:solute carrier organic anion transporter family member 4A1-like [Bolinopsis microptera]|uniref:solute carrier organic anion transporter family member 4A1-like n=1 Tax=Bolinopsis microptera TaxID=2820187 RepID=UPI003079111F